ncbi:MAG: helix-turn-helix transcriptional regulator [Selenomonadales bacterium]|nr:helix-turn-helix transcriptional regulator [Selenomonadales bacterium]
MENKNPLNMRIGKRIKEARRKLKLTQMELAESIGRTESSVRKYEAGKVTIPIDVIAEIAYVLKVPAFDLIGSLDREEREDDSK